MAATDSISRQKPQCVVLAGPRAAEVLRQPSRSVPIVDGTWTPDDGILADIATQVGSVLQPLLDERRTRLAAWFVSARERNASDYCVQCVGIVRAGRRLVYLNGFQRHPTIGSDVDGWRTVPVIVCDGGQGFFGAEYDPETRRITRLVFNGPYSSMNPTEGCTFSD